MKYFLIPVLLFACIKTTSGSHSGSEKEIYKQGVYAFESGDYKTAGFKFVELIKLDSTNAEYHFLAGLSVYKTEIDMNVAIRHMENATMHFKGDTIAEVYYYLGKIYHLNEQPELALKSFKTFQRHIKSSKQGELLAQQVKIDMDWISNSLAKNHIEEKVTASDIEVRNLGEAINSEYGDYAPVRVSGERIAFTSRRPNGNPEFAYDGKPYEDIYFAVKKDDWSMEEKIDKSIIYPAYNTLHHDAFVSMDEESKTIYIYRYNKIHSSVYAEGRWSRLEEVKKINQSSHHTPSVALTPDGKTMYFAHEQKDGLGGKDIYVTKLNNDGSWSQPENMGAKINTPLNEDAPFITSDGKTLYFSSEGRGSIGGFDFFRIRLDEPTAQSEHLQYPFNTVANDIFIIADNSGKSGIFSSSRKGGKGGMDLYEFFVNVPPDTLTIIASHTDADSVSTSATVSISTTGTTPDVKGIVFQKNFGYNKNDISGDDAGLNDWVGEIAKLAASGHKITVVIESSASKVPTTTFKNNKTLADLRAANAKTTIESLLKAKGADTGKISFDLKGSVNGPAYKGDYETGMAAYEKFQYVKFSVIPDK